MRRSLLLVLLLLLLGWAFRAPSGIPSLARRAGAMVARARAAADGSEAIRPLPLRPRPDFVAGDAAPSLGWRSPVPRLPPGPAPERKIAADRALELPEGAPLPLIRMALPVPSPRAS